MNMCTSWWHTSARCYTLLEVGRFNTGAPTSTIINTSQWFPSLGAWTHLWSCVGKFKPCSEAFRLHITSKTSLHLMCMKCALFFVSYSLFDLIYRTKLCSFWNFLLEGFIEFWTTWYLSVHTSITFPIGTCMTPNLQKCKLDQSTRAFNSSSKLMTSTITQLLS